MTQKLYLTISSLC